MPQIERKPARPALPELLAPAGNLEKLKTAVHYGADAVYLGGKQFSLRQKAGNFSLSEMEEARDFLRPRGVKLYVAVNIFAHNDDFLGLDDYARQLDSLGIDALIVADPGIFNRIRRLSPKTPIHLSTQANITNLDAARFWFAIGAKRLNLARELSLTELQEIRAGVAGELEVFAHGALCISYSGRCMLSNYMVGRDANRGECAHPCRYGYALVEEKRPGHYFPVEEDGRGAYIFNSRDLCLLPRLPLLISARIDALKIEGRMKSVYYVGGATRVYRAALDYLANIPVEAWAEPENIVMPPEFMAEIARVGSRGVSENFFFGRPGPEDMLYDATKTTQLYEPVALVREAGKTPLIEARTRFAVGDEIEYLPPGLATIPARVAALVDAKGANQPLVNPGQTARLHTHPALPQAMKYGLFRRLHQEATGEN
ncbi:MAG: U32 family peptidase [Desulfobulbaceae bacterium]|jgi:putative protease|nr:U32 family peptidase [Desulfobulbaceae bacterium]